MTRARAMLADDRRDLTHLPAFAIDDPWTDTPDDAVSFEPETGRLWVHVADAAALVAPDSPLDLDARARATSLYLPETVVPMLPEAATPALGLGLGEVSPALSFALTVNADGELTEVEVVPSLVHVSRLSYEEAEARLAEEPFRTIYALGLASEARRQRDGAHARRHAGGKRPGARRRGDHPHDPTAPQPGPGPVRHDPGG